MLSRLLGLIRNQILSHFFGASLLADAFIAAFTIPNALRRLFGEGALTPAFVSIFTRNLGDERSWKDFLSSTFAWLTIVITGLCILGMIFAPELVHLYVPNFKDVPGKFELTVNLTRFLFPYLLLIAWSALFMGILNSFKTFAISAAGPAISNITVILVAPICLLYLYPDSPYGIFIFGGSFLLGALLQTGANFPFLKKLDALPKMYPVRLKNKNVKELGILLSPAILSMGVHQLNIIVNRVFASDFSGGVSHLYYADLLVELPVSLIATSMGVAAVPSFTRLYIEGDRKALNDTFLYSMGLNLLLAIPSMIGLILLSFPILSTIFYTGAFTLEDTEMSSRALVAYCVGLPFFCALRSILPLYFAQKDTKTPALAGLAALLVNFISAWSLSKTYGPPGIALATSLASIVQFSILASIIYFRFRDFLWSKVFITLGKTLVAGAIMGGALFWLNSLVSPLVWQNGGVSFVKLMFVFGMIAIAGAIYFMMANFLKIEAFTLSWNHIRSKLNKK